MHLSHDPLAESGCTRVTVARMLARYPHVPRRALRPGARMLAHSLADHCVTVLEGALAVEHSSADEAGRIIEVLGPGAGIVCARTPFGQHRPCVLHALAATQIVRVPTLEFERLVEQDDALARAVAQELCLQNASLRQRVAAQKESAADRRLVSTLRYLAERLGNDCPIAGGRRIPVTQSIIARVAGLARQTVNRNLRELAGLGILRVEHSMVCILDPSALASIHEARAVDGIWAPSGPCRIAQPRATPSCLDRVPVPQHLIPLRYRRPA
jgi:CRP/FNR family transcriptional regulator, cyclic AMP receptor protein